MRGGLGKKMMEEMAFFDSLNLSEDAKVVKVHRVEEDRDFNPAVWPSASVYPVRSLNEADWEDKVVKNPKTGNMVKVKSLPPEEKAKFKPKDDKAKKVADSVIGKTQSGKAVHMSPEHPSHSDFTKQDHLDAAVHHDDHRKQNDVKLYKSMNQHGSGSANLGAKQNQFSSYGMMHRHNAQTHRDMADKSKK